MKRIIILLVLLILIGCNDDKITNPDSTVFEKTVKPSLEEQIIESGNEFKMIFPANSISGDLEVKVKKESSVPAMNIPYQKPGKNFYKIKFSGDTDFLKPVQIIINYDKSAIPTGKTAQETVFGYIYSSGTWKLADYQLDEPNGKIIISISSILGKTYKDEPILLDDGEIIIGEGYTTTDGGQNDVGFIIEKNPTQQYFEGFTFLKLPLEGTINCKAMKLLKVTNLSGEWVEAYVDFKEELLPANFTGTFNIDQLTIQTFDDNIVEKKDGQIWNWKLSSGAFTEHYYAKLKSLRVICVDVNEDTIYTNDFLNYIPQFTFTESMINNVDYLFNLKFSLVFEIEKVEFDADGIETKRTKYDKDYQFLTILSDLIY